MQKTPDKKRIVFPFVEAGLGHIMPMKAVADAFEDKYGHLCEVVRTYFFQDKQDDDMLYVEKMLIKEVHKHNKSRIHGFIQFLAMRLGGSNTSNQFLHKVYWKRGFKPSMAYMQELNADLIFNTHFSTLYYACQAKQQGLIDSKVVMFCTDPIVERQWDRRSDVAVVFSSTGKEKAEKIYGFKKRKTPIMQVPFLLRKDIAEYTKTRQAYKEEVGIPPDQFTILLSDGAYGRGRLRKTVYELLKSDIPLTIVAVCGKNEALYKEFSSLQVPSHITFKPFGFTDKMLLFSAACDLFIGKTGSSSLAESSYFGVPAIITLTATSLDKGIANHYTKHVKNSVKLASAKKAASLAIAWAKNPSLMDYYIQNSKTEHRCDGPDQLADILWGLLNKPTSNE